MGVGLKPRDVDELEMWEVAACLGQNRPDLPMTGPTTTASIDPIRARLEAAKRGEKVDPKRARWGQNVTPMRRGESRGA